MREVSFQPWHDRASEPADDIPVLPVVRCVGHGWVERVVPFQRPDGLTVGKVVRVYRAFSNTPKFKQEESK